MIVLGLDVSTSTGWALTQGRNPDNIVSGVMKVSGGAIYEKADRLEIKLHRFIKERGKPDFCMIEAPMMIGGPNPVTVAEQCFLSGVVKAIVGGYIGSGNIDFVSTSMWRKRMYGFGTQKGWVRKDWKKHAMHHCEKYLKIPVRSDDEAEAILIGLYAFTSQKYKMKTMAQ